jgi:hypothetical protein
MAKRSKFAGLVLVFRLLGGFCFLLKLCALAAILIVCVPPRCDWQVYCLALYVPLLLISLALSIWWVVKELPWHTEIDKNRGGHKQATETNSKHLKV